MTKLLDSLAWTVATGIALTVVLYGLVRMALAA